MESERKAIRLVLFFSSFSNPGVVSSDVSRLRLRYPFAVCFFARRSASNKPIAMLDADYALEITDGTLGRKNSTQTGPLLSPVSQKYRLVRFTIPLHASE